MKKAAIYARYSGENQRDESIDAQIFAIEEIELHLNNSSGVNRIVQINKKSN